MTGVVIDYDRRHHTLSVIVRNGAEERALRVRATQPVDIGDEVEVQPKNVIGGFAGAMFA